MKSREKTGLLIAAFSMSLATIWVSAQSLEDEAELLSVQEMKERGRRASESKAIEMGLGELEKFAVSGLIGDLDQAKQYKGANTDLLFSMLNENLYGVYWGQIAQIITIVGSEEDLFKVRDWVISPLADVEQVGLLSQARARQSAMTGLKRASQEQPINWVNEFLIQSAGSQYWVDKLNVSDMAAQELARAVLKAVAVSGSDDSIELLNKIKSRAAPSPSLQAQSQSLPVASDDYLEAMITVAKDRIAKSN